MKFRNKAVLITGASSGLGRELAIKLNQEGAHVALFARNKVELMHTVSQFKNTNCPSIIIEGDVTKEADCAAAVTKTISQFNQMDHLVLNAGVSMWSTFEALPDVSAIRHIMETNYLGVVQSVYHALPYLKKTKGLITTISSVQGKIGVPFHTGYAASKHALHGFFDSLRIELKNQIDIFLVCPSWIQDTSLKNNAYPPQQDSKLNQRKSNAATIPIDVCVKAIVAGMNKRRRELIIPKTYQWLPLVKFFMPRLLDHIIAKKM